MPSSNGGELAEAFREISHEFKTLQQTRLPRDSAAGLSSLDVDELSAKLDNLRSSLGECLTEIDCQRREAQLAAGGAEQFYRALGDAIGADAKTLRRREDEINSINEPGKLTDQAAQRDEENEELAKGLRLKSTVAEIGEKFQRLEDALKESAINCERARKRAAVLTEELEEAKRREEERRRQEAEEAERRRQEELRRRQAAEAAAAKAAAEEEERRRRREEEDEEDGGGDGSGRRRRKSSSSRRRARARAEAEAQRKREAEAAAAAAAAEEAERRWPPVLFSASLPESDEVDAAIAAAAADLEYACAIRAPDGAVQVDDYKCTLVPLEQADLGSIPPGDELVSCVVQFEPAGLARGPLTGERGERRHWYFMLPHCAQRQTARETVVYIYEDGHWLECPSTETHIDGLEGQTRWVETRITEATVTAVAVNKLKTDRFHVGKPGIRYCSSVDNRICLTVPEDALKIQLDQSLEVQPIDSSTLASIKSQLPRETHGLLTCSSIIQHTSLCKNTLRPATFSFPLTLNPSGASKPRPGTAATGRRGGDAAPAGSGRPMTARPKASPSSEDDDELIVLLGCDGHRRGGGSGRGGSGWNVLDNLDIEEEPGKDIVAFRTARFYDRRFIAFRVKPEFNSDTANRICEAIEKSLEDKLACFVLRQKSDNLTEVSLALTASTRLDRTLKQLHDGGYDYDSGSGGFGGGGSGNGVGISEDIRVRERQQFRLRFRGNIICEEDDPERPSEFVLHYNSQMKNRLRLSVTERDRFAQRALDQFRGFLEVTTDIEVQKLVKDAKKASGHQTVTVIEEVVVAKMLICVPKSEEEMRVKSPRTTNFVFKSNDSVTVEYLRELADLVRDNWEFLAEKLDVSRKRCSVIKKNSESQEGQAYDMLITWVKKLPVLKNKVLILCRALNASGYPDLAASLRDAERDRRLRQQADPEENEGDYY